MSIPTQVGMQGFIASAPRLTFTEWGKVRLYARVGCEHRRKESDGSVIEFDATFHDLVAFGAERAYERFRPDDRSLASGYVGSYEVGANGVTATREEFVARRVGHDLARTTYEVRQRRADSPAPGTAAERATEPVVGL